MKKALFLVWAILISTSYLSNQLKAAAIIIPVEKNKVIEKPDPATVKAATDEFKNLSRKERKERIKEVKNEIRKFNATKKSGGKTDTNTLLLVILAILLPPLAVYLHEDATNNRFWISVILTLLFWLPGVIYALVVILGDK